MVTRVDVHGKAQLSRGLLLLPLAEGAVSRAGLGTSTVGNQGAGSNAGRVLLARPLGEAPLLGDDHQLTAGELMHTEGQSETGWMQGSDGCEHTLNLERRRASMAWAWAESFTRTERMGWPMLTRATLPYGFPKAPRIPVWRL